MLVVVVVPVTTGLLICCMVVSHRGPLVFRLFRTPASTLAKYNASFVRYHRAQWFLCAPDLYHHVPHGGGEDARLVLKLTPVLSIMVGRSSRGV
jgi:hypothetical protein